MRRFSLYLVLTGSLAVAQNAPSENPQVSALMAEVRELRLAVERSTLLGARTQIAIQRLQMQEERVTNAAKTLEDARKETTRMQQERTELARAQKDLEAELTQTASSDARRSAEVRIDAIKQRLADASADAQVRAREGEAFSQLQTEQSRLDQLNAAISQMEQALDTVIRQVTAGH
jgi:DNA repair exonuclease SbcCD ATPase subunit